MRYRGACGDRAGAGAQGRRTCHEWGGGGRVVVSEMSGLGGGCFVQEIRGGR